MLMSIPVLLTVASLVVTILAGIGKAPLWPAVLLLGVALLVMLGVR